MIEWKLKAFLKLNIAFKGLPSLSFLPMLFLEKHSPYLLSSLCQVPHSLLNLLNLASVFLLFPWNSVSQVDSTLPVSRVPPKWFLILVTLDFFPLFYQYSFLFISEWMSWRKGSFPLFLCPSLLVPSMLQHWGLVLLTLYCIHFCSFSVSSVWPWPPSWDLGSSLFFGILDLYFCHLLKFQKQK